MRVTINIPPLWYPASPLVRVPVRGNHGVAHEGVTHEIRLVLGHRVATPQQHHLGLCARDIGPGRPARRVIDTHCKPPFLMQAAEQQAMDEAMGLRPKTERHRGRGLHSSTSQLNLSRV